MSLTPIAIAPFAVALVELAELSLDAPPPPIAIELFPDA